MPIQRFTDTSTPWGDNLINRWQVTLGADPWSSPGDSGTPWSSGGGMWEVSTPYGPGFRFVATPEMQVMSGGKMSLMADIDNLVQGVGYTEDWYGMVMLPSSGNRNGFPAFGDWNCLWEFRGQGDVWNQFGVDGLQNKLYVRTYDASRNSVRKALSPSTIQLDHWYSFRWRIKWSKGSDGLVQFWLDGLKIADWTGPNLASGDKNRPDLQFGFYSGATLTNEAWYAGIRKA
jgi:hypothetical protein